MEPSITTLSILTSICDQGIVARGQSHACISGENDPISNLHVHCNYFHPDIPDHPETNFEWVKRQAPGEARIAHQLHSLVYNEKTGMYPVALEKYPGEIFDTDAAYLKKLAERIQNTVCLILDKDAIKEKGPTPLFNYGDSIPYLDMPTHLEYRYTNAVPPKHIRFVLVPLHLAALAKQIFGQKVIPVTDYKADISLGLMHDQAPMMRYFGQEGRVTLIAPDYLKALKELAPRFREGFMTHVVRLPVTPQLQKQAGEKKFLFTIALNQQSKIVRIASSALFRIRKCCDADESKYQVVCKEEDAATLTQMFLDKT